MSPAGFDDSNDFDLSNDFKALPELFDRAVALSGPEREAFLVTECASDAALLAELRRLLAADDAASGIAAWDRTALETEARAAASAPDPSIGERIGPYRIVEAIGSGGMGKVYRAVRADSQYEQSVAIKRIRRGFEDFAARFRTERQILANLEHPNIARLLDGGASADGMPYLVMEYIEGVAPQAYAETHQLSVASASAPQCISRISAW